MLQSFEDEFDLSKVRETQTPAEPGTTLPKVDDDAPFVEKEHHQFPL